MPKNLEVISELQPLFDQFEGVLLDAYGVFWNGNESGMLPGAKELMEKLVAQGKIVGILSNATTLAAKEVAKVKRHGLIQDKHFHFYVTSGEIARANFLSENLPFQTPTNNYWAFGGKHPRFSSYTLLFEDSIYREVSTIEQADFIYISIPHIDGEDQLDPEVFREDVKRIKAKNLPMICANPDKFAHEGHPPRPVVRQGSIATLYEEMGGDVFYIGKPSKAAYETAIKHFSAHGLMDLAKILMIGDNPETDVRGAKCVGLPVALITETGVMANKIELVGLQQALADLPAEDFPNYFIKRFSNDICFTS